MWIINGEEQLKWRTEVATGEAEGEREFKF